MVSETKFKLTKSQIDKIKTAFKHQNGVTLKLNLHMINPRGFPIVLTEKEKSLLKDNMNHNIEIPFSRLKEIDVRVGGILPLIPILIAALTGLSLAGGTAAGISSAVKNAKDIANEKRKTEAQIENDKRKTEAYIASTKDGSGFFLKSARGMNLGTPCNSGEGFTLQASRRITKPKRAILDIIEEKITE
jgi:hypothetical protein